MAIIRANSPTPVTRNQATKSIAVWLTGAFRTSHLCSTKSDASFLVNDEHSREQISLSKVRFIDSLLNSTFNKYFSVFFFQTWHFFFNFNFNFFKSKLVKNKNHSVGMFTYQSRKQELCAQSYLLHHQRCYLGWETDQKDSRQQHTTPVGHYNFPP